mmetsp:Transcript_88580/g.143493  ORF Transcript_88580/g.143493 Transcript_88580/m.143493 type:complete len:85 (-) Transcript_88580:142-396(-)
MGFWREVGREAKEIQMLASHTPITCVDIQKSAVSLKRWPEIVRGFKDLVLFCVFLATFGSVMYFQNRPREVFMFANSESQKKLD